MSQERGEAPTKPGYYWARWTAPAEGTFKGEMSWERPSWEIVQVNANIVDWADNLSDDEALSVSVPGVRETQWLDCFIWGKFVAELERA